MERVATGITLNRHGVRIALALICLLAIFPMRALVATALYSVTSRVLDDTTTEGLDVVPVSGESLPAYNRALTLLARAALWDPGNADYPKALSKLYMRLGTWAEIMEGMGEKLPEGMLPGKEAQERAEALLKRAIELEPANPDYHLALGQWYARAGRAGYDQELQRAVELYPENSPLRFAVAIQYLLAKENGKALEQAKILAARDDSYILLNVTERELQRARRTEFYRAFLAKSYLFQSLEITWRATNKNVNAIKSMVPDDPDARETAQLFFELKGVEE
jgi:tetratricopeptide (TPR) repeat protein